MNNLFLFILLTTYISAFDLVYFHDKLNHNITIFTNSVINTTFFFNQSKCCTIPQWYTNTDTESTLNFTLFKEPDIEFNSTRALLSISNEKVSSVNITDKLSIFPILQRPDIIEIQIFNLCESGDVARVNWIQFEFELNTRYKFEFFKKCEAIPYKHPTNFVTDFICILSIAVIIFISTKFHIKTNVDYINQEINSNKCNIEWWHGIVLVVVSFISIIMISWLGSAMISFFSIVFYCVLIVTTGVTLAHIGKNMLKMKCFSYSLKSFFKKEIYKNIKLYRVIAFIIGIFLVVLFMWSHHWYLANLFFVGFIFGAMKIISIDTFIDVLLLGICFVAFDMYWLISSLYLNWNYREFALNQFDEPLKFVMQRADNYEYPCNFISGWDCLILGWIIKYSKNFDWIKGKVKEEYFITSLIFLGIGSLCSYLLQIWFPRPLILLFPILIILISGWLVTSFLKGDWNDFWNGKNIAGMKKAANDIIEGDFEEFDDKDVNDDKHIDNKRYDERERVEDFTDLQSGFKQVSK